MHSPTVRPQKVARTADCEEDLDGETLLDSEADSETQSNVHVGGTSPVRWSIEHAGDETLVDLENDAASHDNLSVTKSVLTPSPVPKHAEPVVVSSDWPTDAAPLLTRIRQRGREPLLPSHWKLDFRFLPDGLFYPSDPKINPYITSFSNQHFRATKALSELISLGPKIRDKVALHLAPEPLIAKGVSDYTAWSLRDGNHLLDHHPRAPLPSVLAIQTGSTRVPVPTLQNNIRRKFRALVQEWRDVLRPEEEVPTLYGLIVSHTLSGLVAWDVVDAEQRGMRTMAMFDYGQGDYDVWNSLALAILVVHCRDVVIELKNLGALKEEEEEVVGGGDSDDGGRDDEQEEDDDDDDPDA